jgi:xanthine dehydrogenase/oxidase
MNHLPSHASTHQKQPPLFLGASVYFAIREAVAAHRRAQGAPQPDVFRLDSPATCERIRLLCSDGVVEQLNSKAPSSNKTPWALQHV